MAIDENEVNAFQKNFFLLKKIREKTEVFIFYFRLQRFLAKDEDFARRLTKGLEPVNVRLDNLAAHLVKLEAKLDAHLVKLEVTLDNMAAFLKISPK
jgi:hypothetical protein